MTGQTPSSKEITAAAALLRSGQCVAFPTETVYGLGAVATNAAAVARIFSIKQRPYFDPLIVHLAHADDLDRVAAEIPAAAAQLVARHWPGPITVVLRKRDSIPDIVTAGLPTVAVRVPNHPVALELIRRAGEPVAAPSANPFGYVSPTSAAHVRRQLGEAVPMILDGGPCQIGVESTIISFEAEIPTLLRPGGLPLETLEREIGKIAFAANPLMPNAPGQLPQHYAPRVPVEIIAEVGDVPTALRANGALLTIAPPEDRAGFALTRHLSDDGNLEAAAANLFATLRELDDTTVSVVYAIPPPEKGLGLAIADRLRRAAHSQ